LAVLHEAYHLRGGRSSGNWVSGGVRAFLAVFSHQDPHKGTTAALLIANNLNSKQATGFETEVRMWVFEGDYCQAVGTVTHLTLSVA
jgi:hypothetical protein